MFLFASSIYLQPGGPADSDRRIMPRSSLIVGHTSSLPSLNLWEELEVIKLFLIDICPIAASEEQMWTVKTTNFGLGCEFLSGIDGIGPTTGDRPGGGVLRAANLRFQSIHSNCVITFDLKKSIFFNLV